MSADDPNSLRDKSSYFSHRTHSSRSSSCRPHQEWHVRLCLAQRVCHRHAVSHHLHPRAGGQQRSGIKSAAQWLACRLHAATHPLAVHHGKPCLPLQPGVVQQQPPVPPNCLPHPRLPHSTAPRPTWYVRPTRPSSPLVMAPVLTAIVTPSGCPHGRRTCRAKLHGCNCIAAACPSN